MKRCYRKVVTGVVGVVGMTILAFQGISYAGGPIGGATLNPQGDIDKAIKGSKKIQKKEMIKDSVRKRVVIDPAVNYLAVSKLAGGKLRITAQVKNIGNTDFVAGPDQARLIIEIHEMPLTTAESYHTLAEKEIRQLRANSGVRHSVDTDCMMNDFIGYGHRTPTPGEAQVIYEVIAYLEYATDMGHDRNPANDDHNSRNNRKTEEIRVMMNAPI